MDNLLELKDLHTQFAGDQGVVRAVNGVSFAVKERDILCVVGESGCGKSVTARSILRILSNNATIPTGSMLFKSDVIGGTVDLAQMDPKGPEIRRIRGREIAMIFQEPMTSFSPVYTIGNQIQEVIRLHQKVDDKTARERAIAMLARVGIPRADIRIDAYPHQLSGGLRQRAMMAMALSCSPKLLLADEPTTALDVTIQAQVLRLIKDMTRDLGMAVILITHDLGVVAEVADTVAVMYLGKVVERGPVGELFANPKHPYTQALLKSIPAINRPRQVGGRLKSIHGVVPDAHSIPPGCSFHTRCDYFMKGKCEIAEPEFKPVNGDHYVSCFLMDEEY